MGTVIGNLIAGLVGIGSPQVYFLVFAIATLETASFVGMFIPGDTAVMLSGVVVSYGHAQLLPMIVVAAVGAVCGDTIGYELGRRFGGVMRTSRLGRRIKPTHWARAEAYLARRGGWAVTFGRFISIGRVLVPFIAGSGGMPYRRFAVFNAVGAAVWASAEVLLGFIAGHSYKQIEHLAGHAGRLVAATLLAVGLIALATRWAVRHPAEIRARVRAVTSAQFVQRIDARFSRQLGFIGRRFDTRSPMGRTLTVLLGSAALLLYGFLSVTEDVVTKGETLTLDDPVSNFLIANRAPWLTHVMLTVTQLGNTAVLAPTLIVVALGIFLLRRTWKPAAFLAFVIVGSVVSSSLLKVIIARPRPTGAALVTALGYAFPSGHATASSAAWLAIAVVLGRLTARWAWRVVLLAIAITMTAMVGVSRVYLGVHQPSDVLGGWALGTMWLLLGLLAVHLRHVQHQTKLLTAS